MNKDLKKILKLHSEWLKDKTSGMQANLREANLQGANLRWADLRGADLDFSCLPLWCGSQFKADARICKQLVAHALRIMELSDEGSTELRRLMTGYKSGWHRESEF